jgi:hypothetical protein
MQDDDRIDKVVRAASGFAVDESRLAQAVLRRIRDDDIGLFGVFSHGWRRVPLAFALVLMATPVIVTQLPVVSDDDAVAALVVGDGLLGASALDALLTGEVVE